MKLVTAIFFAVFFSVSSVFCQESTDIEQTTIPIKVPKEHSPKKAGWFSAALPGLGQGYNKKYWKIPIVWAGFGATGYFIYTNAVPMSEAKAAYIWVSNKSEGEPPNEFVEKYGTAQKLESVYNSYRYNVELFAIISIAWYALNILDAVVDAHLKNFDISEDLSMSISPFVLPPTNTLHNSMYAGFTVKLNF